MTKAKSGKKIGILFAVLAMICCAVAAAVLSACDDTPTAQSGDEAGVYYYDDADRDRLARALWKSFHEQVPPGGGLPSTHPVSKASA